MKFRMQLLAGAIAATLAAGGATAGLENPRNEWARGYDPDDPEWLAAPRTNSHPVDVMVFLADWGSADALETLREWEAMPERRPILNSRTAYREWKAREAKARLAEIDTGAEEPAAADGSNKAERAAPAVAATAKVAEKPSQPVADEAAAKSAPEKTAKTAPAEGEKSPAALAAAGEAADEPEQGSEPDAEFSAEIDRLRSELGQVRAERDELAERLAALEDEHRTLLARHQALQIDFDALVGEHDHLQLAYAELQSDHEQVLTENRQLIAANADLKERVATLESTNETLRLALIEHATRGQNLQWAEETKETEPLEAAAEDAESPAIAEVEPEPTMRSVVVPEHLAVDENAIRLNRLGMDALEEERPADAARWFLQAARAGSTNAMNNLGYLFEHGWGTIKSPNEARIWYQRAAEGGHHHAMRNLARFYLQGIGGRKDARVAAHWRTQADAFEAERLAQGRESGDAPQG